MIRQIGIKFMNSLERMMLNMIPCKGNGAGQSVWQIRSNGGNIIPEFCLEKQVMSTFMNHYKQRMIQDCTNRIGRNKNYPPFTVAQQIRHQHHSAYHSDNSKNGVWIFAYQLAYF